MRKKKDWITVMVSKETKKRLEKDRQHFQKVIGDGMWSLDDTLKEYHKRLDNLNNKGDGTDETN